MIVVQSRIILVQLEFPIDLPSYQAKQWFQCYIIGHCQLHLICNVMFPALLSRTYQINGRKTLFWLNIWSKSTNIICKCKISIYHIIILHYTVKPLSAMPPFTESPLLLVLTHSFVAFNMNLNYIVTIPLYFLIFCAIFPYPPKMHSTVHGSMTV